MDISLRQKALKNLAKTGGDKAIDAITKESDRISNVLSTSVEYEEISANIELLDIIGYRVFEKAIDVIIAFLERLNSIELTYADSELYTVERIKKYQNNNSLIEKALEVLEHIRYHNPERVLNIFFEYSAHENKKVSEKAETGIKKFSEYNIDIFYGDGKEWNGLQWQPQEKILEKISSFNDISKKQYISSIMLACNEVLSPTITGTTSNYKTVTWQTGVIPVTDGMRKVRNGAMEELKLLFSITDNLDHQKQILNTMHTATDTPHMGEYGDELINLITESTITYANFLKEVTKTDNFELKQKIEHDAYWLNYHRGSLDPEIKRIALEIRDELYSNNEFMIFRILIGFESIFHEWEEGKKPRESYKQEQDYREDQAKQLAESITAENYDQWKERIISYSKIRSNDLAMFPYFGKFLEYFGRTSPDLAIHMAAEESDNLGGFSIALLRGTEETKCAEKTFDLMKKWCKEGKHLFSLARFFEFSKDLQEELFESIYKKSIELGDLAALNQIIVTIAAKYDNSRKDLLNDIFLPVLEKLTKRNNNDWIYNFWYRKERADLLGDVKPSDYKIILNNLVKLESIDYHAEEVLIPIAEKSPELVIQFFCERIALDGDAFSRFDAIPYSLGDLSVPLSKKPEQVIQTIKGVYDGDYGVFIYRGANLIKNIFPSLESDAQSVLIDIASSTEKQDLLFVYAILRNYDGDPVIHPVCKELVKILPEDGSLKNELLIILSNTGVVSGEYGFPNAYKQKIEEIQSWLSDEDKKVIEFAKEYIAYLEIRIKDETNRADEQVALMKHQYGDNKE